MSKVAAPPPPPPPAPAPSALPMPDKRQTRAAGGNLLDVLGGGAFKLKRRSADSFTIRNLKCEPTTGGDYKTKDECEVALADIKSNDLLMATLNAIDPQYRDALVKYERKASELEKARQDLAKARAQKNSGRVAAYEEEIQKLEEALQKLGAATAQMEQEFRAALPADKAKVRDLAALIRQKGGITNLANFRQRFKEAVGASVKLPARLEGSVKAGVVASRKGTPQPRARVAEVQGAGHVNANGVPMVINIYNNIAAPAAAVAPKEAAAASSKAKSPSSAACINCPPLPKSGKRKLDTYILGTDGQHHRIYVGSRGALYVKIDGAKNAFQSLGVMSKKIK